LWGSTLLVILLVASTALSVYRQRKIPWFTAMFLWGMLLFAPSVLTVERHGMQYVFANRNFHFFWVSCLVGLYKIFLTRPTLRFNLVFPVAVLIFSSTSWIRVHDWRDNVSLFSAEMVHNPSSMTDLSNLCHSLFRIQAFTEAEKHLRIFESSYPIHTKEQKKIQLDIRTHIAFFRDGDVTLAHGYISEARKLAPTDFHVLKLWAIIHTAAGYPKDTIRQLQDKMVREQLSPQQTAQINDTITFIKNSGTGQSERKINIDGQ
jgi:hypothetical protein